MEGAWMKQMKRSRVGLIAVIAMVGGGCPLFEQPRPPEHLIFEFEPGPWDSYRSGNYETGILTKHVPRGHEGLQRPRRRPDRLFWHRRLVASVPSGCSSSGRRNATSRLEPGGEDTPQDAHRVGQIRGGAGGARRRGVRRRAQRVHRAHQALVNERSSTRWEKPS
jgi:hypothetical protein